MRDFSNAPLNDGAIEFLGALGLKGEPHGNSLLRDSAPEKFLCLFNNVREKMTEHEIWTYDNLIIKISLLFQITSDETELRPVYGEGGGIIAHSIYFVAADIQPHMTQGELKLIIHALNKGCACPLIGLFRYGRSIALAATAQRMNKRNNEKDAFIDSGATININLIHPSWEHGCFLVGLRRIIMSGQPKTLGDVVMYLCNVLDECLFIKRMNYNDNVSNFLDTIPEVPLFTPFLNDDNVEYNLTEILNRIEIKYDDPLFSHLDEINPDSMLMDYNSDFHDSEFDKMEDE